MKAREKQCLERSWFGATRLQAGQIPSATSFQRSTRGRIMTSSSLHKTITPNSLRMVIQPILHHNHNH